MKVHYMDAHVRHCDRVLEFRYMDANMQPILWSATKTTYAIPFSPVLHEVCIHLTLGKRIFRGVCTSLSGARANAHARVLEYLRENAQLCIELRTLGPGTATN